MSENATSPYGPFDLPSIADSRVYTERARVPENISFESFDNDAIRTLSKNTVSDGADIEGLLYVPTLDPSDSCVNTSQSYVQHNATRKSDLPSEQYSRIAFAPWISVPCTKSYLAASAGARALITYLPDNGATIPPLVNDEVWDLHDGGQWKIQNKFPVYAIPGAEGASIMQQLGQYSGNSSNARIADLLAQEQFDPSDYVRIYTSLGTSDPTNLPTLWAFLLIVLGLVLLVIGTTSCLMHCVQRRRRRHLQRRVANGQVDLESLGIKRTRITQEAIDSLPTSVYTRRKESVDNSRAPTDRASEEPSVQATPDSTTNRSDWAQPTCPICLDDFIPDCTTVRSLPCHHIYHPECIDPFLRENSSLCPLCKAAVLSPTSSFYVSEPVTNAMVRHERRVRQTRQLRAARMSADGQYAGQEERRRGWQGRFRRRPERSSPDAPEPNQMELQTTGGAAAFNSNPVGNTIERPGVVEPSPSRYHTGRNRGGILNTLPDHDTAVYAAEVEHFTRQPRCESFVSQIVSVLLHVNTEPNIGRKALRAAFPGFR